MKKISLKTGETRVARMSINEIDGSLYQKFQKFDRVRNNLNISNYIDEDTYLISDLHFGKYGNEYDKKIIQLLQEDSSISNIELSKRIGLAPSSCLLRVKNLREQKVLKQFTAVVDEKILGFDKLDETMKLFGENIVRLNNNYYSSGGRVFALGKVSNRFEEAKKDIINSFSLIDMENLYFRDDIVKIEENIIK